MKKSHRQFYDIFIKTQDTAPAYIRTIWLFTYSDMKTIMFPWLIIRYPLALLWTWSNLLPFDIFNQFSEEAIEEDRINKPWRPLPSGMIDREQAASLMWKYYILALIVSSSIGGLRQLLMLILLGAWYNAGGGADRSFVIRNVINATGILSFAFGAMEVALGTPLLLTEPSVQWMGILAAVIFSTVQTQDLYDMEGDSSRNRKTMPLVVGHSLTRWWTAFMVSIFSVICPAYWSLRWHGFILPMFFGCTSEADKRTFRFWNVWLVSIYFLPFVRFLAFGCSGTRWS
ncbi:UbiA prenyltransferase family-domain-containing protein [Jackrogersella minutella]|nr:UbiA prenyltransferase family-domain-containing protein [Jackrogersella minutella]